MSNDSLTLRMPQQLMVQMLIILIMQRIMRQQHCTIMNMLQIYQMAVVQAMKMQIMPATHQEYLIIISFPTQHHQNKHLWQIE